MGIEVRRVVTGHDASGRAVVLHDGIAANVISQRAKQERCLVWKTDTLPASNEGSEDEGAAEIGVGLAGGSVFGIVRFEAGCAPRVHRTQTIDYGVVIAGRITMEMDGGSVELRQGDVFVQRGTVHAWRNDGPEDCVLAVVMIGAAPLAAGGRRLDPIG